MARDSKAKEELSVKGKYVYCMLGKQDGVPRLCIPNGTVRKGMNYICLQSFV